MSSGVKSLENVVLAIFYLLAVLFFGLPLLWLFVSAVNPQAGIAWSWPQAVTWKNFTNVWTMTGIPRSFLVSAYLAAGSAAVAIIMGALASYPLSRARFRGRLVYLLAILFITGLPITALMVPLFELFVRLGWLNSLTAVMFVMAAFATPISIWLIKSFVDTVDQALEEAAWIDGCSRLRAYWTIILPLVRPALFVVFILDFLAGWSNFYIPFILLDSSRKFPVAVTLYNFFGNYGSVQFGQLAAFSILYSLPVIGLYLLAGGRLGKTLNLGGIKG